MTLHHLKDHDHDWDVRTKHYDNAGVTVRIRECSDPSCDAKEWEQTTEQSRLENYEM